MHAPPVRAAVPASPGRLSDSGPGNPEDAASTRAPGGASELALYLGATGRVSYVTLAPCSLSLQHLALSSPSVAACAVWSGAIARILACLPRPRCTRAGAPTES